MNSNPSIDNTPFISRQNVISRSPGCVGHPLSGEVEAVLGLQTSVDDWVEHEFIARIRRHTFAMEDNTLVFAHQKVWCLFAVFPWVKSIRKAFACSVAHNAWRTLDGAALVGDVVTYGMKEVCR